MDTNILLESGTNELEAVSYTHLDVYKRQGVAYKPDQTPNDISVIGAGVHKVYDEVLSCV